LEIGTKKFGKRSRTLEQLTVTWDAPDLADGNVAGWHGTQYHIDENGNATMSNDGSVRFNELTGTFDITNQSGSGVTTQQTLVPSKTSRDANGEGTSMDIHTGIVDIKTTNTIASGSASAKVIATRESLFDPNLKTTVEINGLGPTVLNYEFDRSGADSLRLGVISILIDQGFTRPETFVDEETGEETQTQVLDTSSSFVNEIIQLTQEIVSFIDGLLGRAPQTP
jgi:hypothetical protein